jgi:hypothetical protein
MPLHLRYGLHRIAALSAIWAGLGISTLGFATEQTTAAAGGNASSIQLKPFTAPDNSASAGVPAGWQVTEATGTAISMKGPNGENISLGNGYIAHDGAFQAGQRGPAGAFMTMPYAAKLTDKLIMILQQDAAVGGKPAPQIQFVTAAPMQLPAAFGQCGRFTINITAGPTLSKAMGVFCSLPRDTAGFFKNFLLMGSATAATAAQDAPIVQAVFASYKIPANWLQRKFAPFTAPPAPQAGSQGSSADLQRAIINQQKASDQGFQCVDLALLDTPNYRTPRACGGTAP